MKFVDEFMKKCEDCRFYFEVKDSVYDEQGKEVEPIGRYKFACGVDAFIRSSKGVSTLYSPDDLRQRCRICGPEARLFIKR